MNITMLVGRITKDISLSYLPNSETAIAKFSIAVDRKVGKGKEKQSDFINIIIFGKTAEFVSQYSAKGKMIAIQGRIQTGSYEKKDGTKVYTTDVVADDVQILEWATDKKDSNRDADMYKVSNESIPF